MIVTPELTVIEVDKEQQPQQQQPKLQEPENFNVVFRKSDPIALSPLSLLNMQRKQKQQNDDNSIKTNDEDNKSLNKFSQNFYSISACSSTMSLSSSPNGLSQTLIQTENSFNNNSGLNLSITKSEGKRCCNAN